MARVTKQVGIEHTLLARGKQYGQFVDHAQITQDLKAVMYNTPAYQEARLTASQREALEMIQHKIGRILNGDLTMQIAGTILPVTHCW